MNEGVVGDSTSGGHSEEQLESDLTAETFSPHDVIFGKGNGINGLPGNLLFRNIIHRYKPTYASAPRNAKGSIAELVIDEIARLHPPGRFLEPQSDNKSFREVSHKRAVEKTCQALRERDKRSVYQSTGYYDHPYSAEPYSYYPPTMDSGEAHHHNHVNGSEDSMNGEENSTVVNTVTTNNSEDPLQKEDSPPSGKSDPNTRDQSNNQAHPAQGNSNEGDGASLMLEENDGDSRTAIEPRDNDVLYGGRGRKHFHRVANQRFLEMIKISRQEYQSSRSKKRVALGIIQQWRQQEPPGRFLQQDSSEGKWYEIPQNKILEKTCQALRDLKRERGPGVVRSTIADRLVDPQLIPMVPRPPQRRIPNQHANMNHPSHPYPPHAGYYHPHHGYGPPPAMPHGYPPMHHQNGYSSMYSYMPPPESHEGMHRPPRVIVDSSSMNSAGGNVRLTSPSQHHASGDSTNNDGFNAHSTNYEALKAEQSVTPPSIERNSEPENEGRPSQEPDHQNGEHVLTSDPVAIQRQAAVVVQEMRKMDDMMRLASSSTGYAAAPRTPHVSHAGLSQPPNLGGGVPQNPKDESGRDTTTAASTLQDRALPTHEGQNDRIGAVQQDQAALTGNQNPAPDKTLHKDSTDGEGEPKKSPTDVVLPTDKQGASLITKDTSKRKAADTQPSSVEEPLSESTKAKGACDCTEKPPPKKKQKKTSDGEREAADILVNLFVPNTKDSENAEAQS